MLLRRIVKRLEFLIFLPLFLEAGCGVVYRNQSGWIGTFTLVNQTTNLGISQGYASSGNAEDSGNYFFDTQALYLSSKSDQMDLVTANRDLLPPGTNHMGDGDYYDGRVYGVIEHWAGCQNASDPIYISIFDAKTLKKEEDVEITADLPEASGIAVIPDANEAVVTSFCDPNNLYVYRMSDWKLDRRIPLSIPVRGIQGAAYREGFLYISQTNGALYALRLENNEIHLLFRAPMRGEFEGVDFRSAQLRWLVNQSGGQHILYSYELK